MKALKVKICGMKDLENCRDLLKLDPDFLGFIFFSGSQRFVSLDNWRELQTLNFSETKKVGVFVNASVAEILEYHNIGKLDIVQLHGDQTPDFCREVKELLNCETWKVFSVEKSEDLVLTENYNQFVDKFVFDTKTESHGGSGQVFNWNILGKGNFSKPYVLSGGLGVLNLKAAIEFAEANSDCCILDFNSKLEFVPGIKLIDQVTQIFREIR
jgi:phosphoribosylanthranilate isomerase